MEKKKKFYDNFNEVMVTEMQLLKHISFSFLFYLVTVDEVQDENKKEILLLFLIPDAVGKFWWISHHLFADDSILKHKLLAILRLETHILFLYSRVFF